MLLGGNYNQGACQLEIKHVLLAVAQSRSLPGALVSSEIESRDAPAGLKSFRQEGEKRKEKENVQLKRSLSRLLIENMVTESSIF